MKRTTTIGAKYTKNYHYLYLMCPPIVASINGMSDRIYTQTGCVLKQSLPNSIFFFECLPPIFHLSLIIVSLGALVELLNQIGVTLFGQDMNRTIVCSHLFDAHVKK